MSSRAVLSAAAEDRKARLAKLRSIKRKQPDDEVVAPESDRTSPAVNTTEHTEELAREESVQHDVSRLHLSGRNYDPETRGARLGFESQPNLAAGDNTLEAQAAKLEAEVRQREEEEEEGSARHDGERGPGEQAGSKAIDLLKLQPKRPNWDLKRELNKRLEPLHIRTDNAISRLVRERLAAKQQHKQPQSAATAAVGESSPKDEGASLDGAALVEGIRLREQEAEDEERRERELEDEDAD
ncbi:hypothetical protein SEPCBS119000_000236 [Sporothrix epigloea]|uniref:Cwf18 pre-mRNA splicing factor n=1 Tax=Sporothrix epigloea TaxID=1892477 RepID=A0ABP0D7P5_9PEZI